MTTIPLSPPVRPSDLPVPPPGYSYALLLTGSHTPEHMLRQHAAGLSLPVLAEADGPLGVLRALQVRMGPIMLDAGAYTLALFRAPVDGHVGMQVWSLDRKAGAR